MGLQLPIEAEWDCFCKTLFGEAGSKIMSTNFFHHREAYSQKYFMVLAMEGFTRHNGAEEHGKDCAGASSLCRQYFMVSTQVFWPLTIC